MIEPVRADTTDAAVDGLPRRYLRLLGDAADRLLAADDPAAMVDDLFALIAGELRLDVFFNYRLDGDVLVLAAHGGLSEAEAAAGARLAIGQAVCGCAARERRPIEAFGVQASTDPMVAFVRNLGIDAYACTPLLHGTTLLGTLGFGRRWADRFDADELAFLHTICRYVALAKYRLQIESELRGGIAARERLLGELNHRVRNALQTAVAVVRLGAADTTDTGARTALSAAAARLEVLATAHRQLYATDAPTRIDVADLLGTVADRIDGEPVTIDGEGVATLPVEQAAAMAMLVQALLNEGDAPAVERVGVTIQDERVLVTLEGPALGQADAVRDGSRLVRGLSQQLRAELGRDGAHRITLSLPFPATPHG
jgi:two-component sensor histidine kinase